MWIHVKIQVFDAQLFFRQNFRKNLPPNNVDCQKKTGFKFSAKINSLQHFKFLLIFFKH